jgi:hypothetical protein
VIDQMWCDGLQAGKCSLPTEKRYDPPHVCDPKHQGDRFPSLRKSLRKVPPLQFAASTQYNTAPPIPFTYMEKIIKNTKVIYRSQAKQ